MENLRLVYRPNTTEEGARRAARAEFAAKNKFPFRHLPGNPPPHKIALVTTDGTKVRVEAVEMVYNDMLLMDFVSSEGIDGPLYRDTVSGRQLEVLEFALKEYAKGSN
jgi:hypothetical protein